MKYTDEFALAQKQEKDSKLLKRILAVRMVTVNKLSVVHVTQIVCTSEQSVRNGAEAYDEYRIQGLQDLPRSDRPPKISNDLFISIVKSIKNVITAKYIADAVQKVTAVYTM